MLALRSRTLAPVIIAAFALGIGMSMVFNYWTTRTTKVPAKFTTGEFAGECNPADIRGSYSLSDISNAFGIPVEVLAQAFGIAGLSNPGEIRARDLEDMYTIQPDGGEVGTDSVRLFISIYTGLPYFADETTRLPGPALAQLEERVSTADFEALKLITVALGELRAPVAAGGAPDAIGRPDDGLTPEHADDERMIRGRTTFAELLDWGLTQTEIEDVLGTAMGARTETVRSFAVEQGFAFSSIRMLLQKRLDVLAGDP